jgi:hypothetical protein
MQEEYYDPVLKGHNNVNNANARRIYFEETEPGELPTHSRVLSTKAAVTIGEAFIYRLIMDVGRNSRISWKPGSKLPGRKDYVQPLADGSAETWEKNGQALAIHEAPEPVPQDEWVLPDVSESPQFAFTPGPVIPLPIPTPGPSIVVTPTELHEVEEMLRKIERLEKNKTRVIIGTGRVPFIASRYALGLAAWAMTAYLTQPLIKTLTGTTVKTQKRRRTQFCVAECANILKAVMQDVGPYMTNRALVTDNWPKRYRRRFKGREGNGK